MQRRRALLWIITVILCLYLGIVFSGMQEFWGGNGPRRTTALENVLRKAAIQCYALEGAYPPDLVYLSRHYGIVLDTDKYFYYYEAFSSNIMPQIRVYEK
ncbi:MAG TPA: hypothetical protein DD727_09125 [Clostridiales bacterium]|nr:hypothetical protein [Clostridiales bacterium]